MIQHNLPFTHDQIQDLNRKYGTPFYLYDLEKIRYQYLSLESSLPNSFKIYYALKANSNLSICHLLATLGSGADVSSLGELFCATESGFTPNMMLLTGSGKTAEILAMAVKKHLGLIVLESVTEARRLNRIAKNYNLKQDVVIRINPLHKESFGEVPISQYASKFGVDEEHAIEVLSEITIMQHLNLVGIHVYTASNVLDYRKMLESMEQTIAIADYFRSQGFPIEVIDFGGGLGVSYDIEQNCFDLHRFSQGVKKLVENSSYPYGYIFEIGRYLVAESACYVCEIMDLKQSRGKQYAILNGGIHQLYRPLMNRANQLLEVISKDLPHQKDKNSDKDINDFNKSEHFTLAGLLPTPADILIEDVLLKSPEIGDLVVIYKCGAYSFNHSLANFALHPYPAEIAYHKGEVRLIRKRGIASDFGRNQMPMLVPKI